MNFEKPNRQTKEGTLTFKLSIPDHTEFNARDLLSPGKEFSPGGLKCSWIQKVLKCENADQLLLFPLVFALFSILRSKNLDIRLSVLRLEKWF